MVNEFTTPDTGKDILSVAELNRRVKRLIDDALPALWVQGEISNFVAARSGHWYFTLKDESAQVRCAMFRGRNARIGMRPEDGMLVQVRARAGLYEQRGEFQLVVDHMEAAGTGALQRAFEALREKLRLEGLFDPAGHREIPRWPAEVGVITSPTGAALQDILSVMARRFPATRIRLYPSSVQGRTAADELVRAIRVANRERRCDVLLVSRGGGSLEDLWPFNEEKVARAIHASTLPVVSAVGHEVDVTIADFVADLRAPTPSAAAELLTPDQQEVRNVVAAWAAALQEAMGDRIRSEREHLRLLRQGLRHPRQVLQERGQHLDHLQIRLARAQRYGLQHCHGRMRDLESRLQLANPRHAIEAHRQRLSFVAHRLVRETRTVLERQRDALRSSATQLEQVSPLATLSRGYAVVSAADGSVVRASTQLQRGDAVHARFASGHAELRVERTEKS